jgi:hypothetical protein
MAGWRIGARAWLWVGRTLDLYCEVCRGAEDAGFDLDLEDILVFLLGKGSEVVMGRRASGIYVL